MNIPIRKPCLRIPVKPYCGCLNCAAWRKYRVSVGGCEHPRWAPATLRGKDDKEGYEVCAECGVFRAPSGMLGDANTFELAAYGGLAGTVDKLLPVDEEADRRADEFEAKRKIKLGGTQTGRFSSKARTRQGRLDRHPSVITDGHEVYDFRNPPVDPRPIEGYRVVIQTRLKEEEWVRDLVKAASGVYGGLADKTLISVDRIHTDPDDGYVWTVPVDPLKLSEAIGGPSVVDRLADPLLAKAEPVVKVIDGSTVKVVSAEDDA